MTEAIRRIFERQIELLQDFHFEDFIKQLFLIKYGTAGFIPTRDKKDKGCDGIIVDSSTVIACFGPKKYEPKAYAKKAKEDYQAYKEKWKDLYPNWQFIFNGKLGPDAITEIKNLEENSIPWGLDHIMSIITNELNGTQRRMVADILGIPQPQIAQDYLAEILENLLSSSFTEYDELYQFKRENLVEVEEKLKLNYSEQDVNIAMEEYADLLPEILETGRLFKIFQDDEQSRIKSKVRSDYKNANGNFKNRLKIITDNYLNIYSAVSDDTYRRNITAILLYLFEQCLIGVGKGKKVI